MNDSFGPINPNKRKYGECMECWDENWTREHGSYFDKRVTMVGSVCKHRFKPAKRLAIQSKKNRMYMEWRETREEYMTDYWARRALLPDYCGEPGELVLGTPGNFIRIDGMSS